jgi:hypothetical protein
VQAAAPAKSNGSDDEDRINDMVADIGMEYDLGSGDQHPLPEVHNFYRLLAALDEKVNNSTELIILQAVTRLMGMKSKYNFLNQCYNNIMKLIIGLIPVKHNMSKDLLPVKLFTYVLIHYYFIASHLIYFRENPLSAPESYGNP